MPRAPWTCLVGLGGGSVGVFHQFMLCSPRAAHPPQPGAISTADKGPELLRLALGRGGGFATP